MSISAYFIKFEQLHQIANSIKWKTREVCWPTYRLLNNAKLPVEKQLVRAIINEMEYQIIKKTLNGFY